MKGHIFIILIMFFTSHSMFALSNPDKAFGHEELEEANTQAWRQGKMIVVDFTAEWCLPCKMMEEETFSRPEVVDLLKRQFIAVQYDIQSFDGVALKNEYAVKSLPTVLVLHPDGTELKRMQGAMSAEKFLTELRSILNTHRVEVQEHYGIERPPLKPVEPTVKAEEKKTAMVLQLGVFSEINNANEYINKLPIETEVMKVRIQSEYYWAVVSAQKGDDQEMKKQKEELLAQGIPCFLKEWPN